MPEVHDLSCAGAENIVNMCIHFDSEVILEWNYFFAPKFSVLRDQNFQFWYDMIVT